MQRILAPLSKDEVKKKVCQVRFCLASRSEEMSSCFGMSSNYACVRSAYIAKPISSKVSGQELH